MNPLVELQEIEIPPAKAEWVRRPPELRLAVQTRARRHLFAHGVRDAGRWLALGLTDAGAFFSARAVARFLRVEESFAGLLPTGYLGGFQFAVALGMALVFVGAYRRASGWRSPRRWAAGVLLATGLVLWQSLWTVHPISVLLRYVITAGSVFAVLAVARGMLVVAVHRLRSRFGGSVATVVIGKQDALARAGQSPIFAPGAGHRVVDMVPIEGPFGHPVALGAELSRVLLATGAGTLFIAGNVSNEQFRRIVEVAQSAGCELGSISRSLEIAGVVAKPRVYNHVPVTVLTRPGLQAHQLLVKRVVDAMCAGVGLVILSPLLLAVAASVKLSSKGPVFFRQRRIGVGGSCFTMLKFRTMRDGADGEKAALQHLNSSGDPRLFKISKDPRVTWVGRFLRAWSLDELPQLANVLKGDMSLVGPRPFPESDLQGYMDHHYERFAVRPGITGLWQVGGRSDIADFETVVRLDRQYIIGWSLGLDFKILLKTIPVILKRRGAR